MAVYAENGDLKELTLSSSLYGKLYFKNELRSNLCPKKFWAGYLMGARQESSTDAMIKGTYFETKAIGGGRTGNVDDLVRLKDGSRSMDQMRIDEQVNMFQMVVQSYGMNIDNVQVHKEMPIEIERFPDIKFKLSVTGDMITPVNIKGYSYPLIVTDLKLTKDRTSEFSEYCWGKPEYMDFFQIILYSTVFNIPGAYLVFDYKPENRGHIFLPVATMAMFPDGKPKDHALQGGYETAKLRAQDLQIGLKNTAYTILKWHAEGYPTEPSYDACDKCPLNPKNQLKEEDPRYICQEASAIKRV